MANPIRFYLETSERSMETHSVRMPEEGDPSTETVVWGETSCGHNLDASWEPYQPTKGEADSWPTCTKCYQAVTKRGWWPHNLELPKEVEK